MNIYFKIGIALLLAVAAFAFGHRTGTNGQKVADQKIFDQYNADTAAAKTQANEIYRKAQADNLALMIDRAALQTKLDQDHADHQKAINDLRVKYSGISLRFATQAPRLGASGAGAVPVGSAPASDAGATVCIVSAEVDASLKSIAYDADSLSADYKLLFDWAHQSK